MTDLAMPYQTKTSQAAPVLTASSLYCNRVEQAIKCQAPAQWRTFITCCNRWIHACHQHRYTNYYVKCRQCDNYHCPFDLDWEQL